MAEEDHRLLTLQLTYEKELANQSLKFAGLSVNEFIYQLLVAGLNKRAERVRADWKVPDKRSVACSRSIWTAPTELCDRFWRIKLKALAAVKDWDGLEAFAKSKRSPIGYEPFVVSRSHSIS